MARRTFGNEIDQFVNLNELSNLITRLNSLGNIITPAKRRQILRRAAAPVRQRSISLAPRSSRVHYRYSTPKLFKGKRAKRGTAKAYRIAYHPGNLKKSLQVLTFPRDKSAVYVGPKWAKGEAKKEHGRTVKSADGYYAQMVFGSAAAFGDRVTKAALGATQRQVAFIVEDSVKKIINAFKAKTGL